MKNTVAVILLTMFSVCVFAQNQKANAISAMTNGYSTSSRMVAPKFAFFESCERMTGQIYGEDPIDHHEREMQVMMMRPRFSDPESAPPRRTVLIIPPTGGVNWLDEQWAAQLCAKGIEAWIITRWDRGQLDYTLDIYLRSHDRAGLRGISAIRQILPHMKGEIGILGTSAGGILASVATAIESRITTGVFIAAGANLPEIVATSDQEKIRSLREERLRRTGWSLAEYKAKLQQAIQLDPAFFEAELAAKKTGVVLALQDKTVPLPQQLLLEGLARAIRITFYNDDHVSTIVKTALFESYRVVDFFDQNL